MRSGDKGHRSCKGHQESNQTLEMLRSQTWLTNSGVSPSHVNGGPSGPENLVLVGRPHLRMESGATPLPVSCQGWTRQGLVGKGQPLLSSGFPFPLPSPSAQVPQDLAKGGRDPYTALSGLQVRQPGIQEHSSSHRPSVPLALSGGLCTHVGAVPRLQLEFVAETGRGPSQEPSQAAAIPARRQPRENSRREEEAWSPGRIPTPRRPADSKIGTFH